MFSLFIHQNIYPLAWFIVKKLLKVVVLTKKQVHSVSISLYVIPVLEWWVKSPLHAVLHSTALNP